MEQSGDERFVPQKIEEPRGAHICRHTWPPLLSPDCDFLNTLIAADPPAKVSLPPPDPLWEWRRDCRLRLPLFFIYHFLMGQSGRRSEADKSEAGEQHVANYLQCSESSENQQTL